MNLKIAIAALLLVGAHGGNAQTVKRNNLAYADNNGVLRWSVSRKEVALFGANYCLPSACDYRAAGYVGADRKRMVDEDLVHFARMGWTALRLSFWGDFENSDTAGNLVNNDHLNLMDYIIAQATNRGIYILLSPIVTYGSLWPDAMNDTNSIHGFSTYYKKEELGTNPRAITVQQTYLKQLLNHVNPYTNTALKDERNILFVEMINEPAHHSDNFQGSVHYINALVDAVRSTGCDKVVFHNYSQDFNMATALEQSKIQGVTFAWYPSGLNSGDSLQGNYLPAVDHYSNEMLRPEIARLARIVYEFDSPDLLNGYMYPAMARSFREVGAQWATMFSYDMLATAPYNLGWQTHCLNMVYTPQKAIGAIIAAKVMEIIPRFKKFGNYPANTSFDAVRLSYAENLAELNNGENFFYSGNTSSVPVNTSSLRKIVGYGSSPIIRYEGKGIYFLDKVSDDVWRLEVYPDAVVVKDPFNMPSPGKVVIRAMHHQWPMYADLPALPSSFSVLPLDSGNKYTTKANNRSFDILPGAYILTGDANFDMSTLPQRLGGIGMHEFVAPVDQLLPAEVVMRPVEEYELNKPIVIQAEVIDTQSLSFVTLSVQQKGGKPLRSVPMKHDSGYLYSVVLPQSLHLHEGWINYTISVRNGKKVTSFPSGKNDSPTDWDYQPGTTWSSKIVQQRGPLTLLNPWEDAKKLAFTRVGDNSSFNAFGVFPSSEDGGPVIRLQLPSAGNNALNDYTISSSVKNRICARKGDIDSAKYLIVHAHGIPGATTAYVTLVEADGTSWSKKISPQQQWADIVVPLSELQISRGVMLPLGYPGRWNYWFTAANGRGKPADKVRMESVERIQFSVRPPSDQSATSEHAQIEIASATLKW